MPGKKRANPAAASGSSLEPAKMKVGELKDELEKRGLGHHWEEDRTCFQAGGRHER